MVVTMSRRGGREESFEEIRANKQAALPHVFIAALCSACVKTHLFIVNLWSFSPGKNGGQAGSQTIKKQKGLGGK